MTSIQIPLNRGNSQQFPRTAATSSPPYTNYTLPLGQHQQSLSNVSHSFRNSTDQSQNNSWSRGPPPLTVGPGSSLTRDNGYGTSYLPSDMKLRVEEGIARSNVDKPGENGIFIKDNEGLKHHLTSYPGMKTDVVGNPGLRSLDVANVNPVLYRSLSGSTIHSAGSSPQKIIDEDRGGIYKTFSSIIDNSLKGNDESRKNTYRQESERHTPKQTALKSSSGITTYRGKQNSAPWDAFFPPQQIRGNHNEKVHSEITTQRSSQDTKSSYLLSSYKDKQDEQETDITNQIKMTGRRSDGTWDGDQTLHEPTTDELLAVLQSVKSRPLLHENGAFSMLDRCVVVNQAGVLGAWTGFKWKDRRPAAGWSLGKITHDSGGYLWSLNSSGELARLTRAGWRSVGLVGNRDLIDIVFDRFKRLWGINRQGDIAVWNGYIWDEREVSRFKKAISICFDRLGSLWVLNSSYEIAKWDSDLREWDMKIMPIGIKPKTIAFDPFNQLWGLTANGQLAQVSGNQWIQLGHVAGWRCSDISFRWK